MRPLLILGVAESVSSIGNWITSMALYSLIIFKGGGNLLHSTGLFVATLGPTALLSPLTGWMCDRFDRRRLMIISQLLSGLAVWLLIHTEPLWAIYLLLVLEAAFSSVMTPARQATIPSLVDSDDLTRANGLLQQLSSIVKIGAPILGGLLLSMMTPRSAMYLDVLSFLSASALLALLPPLPPVAHPKEKPVGETPSRLATSVSKLQGFARIRALLLGFFMLSLILMAFDVSLAVYIRDVLQGDPKLLGILIGAIGVGTVFSTLVLTISRKKRNPWTDVVAGQTLLVTIPASLAVATFLPVGFWTQALVALGCLLGGLGQGLAAVQGNTLIQRFSPPGSLGRLSGFLQSVLVGGQLIGILTVPLMVPRYLSFATYFAGASFIMGLYILYIGFASRHRVTDDERGSAPSMSEQEYAVDE